MTQPDSSQVASQQPAIEAPAVTPSTPPTKPAKKAKLPETTEGMPWQSSHEIKKEPNAFTDGDWRNLTYAWSGLLVRLVIIFGSIFTVVQFLTARSEKRIERTLQLVDNWETPDNQSAVTAINVRLAELNQANQAFLPTNPTEKELAAYMARLGIAAMRPDAAQPSTGQMPQNFDKVVYFLNRVAFCVEGNLCDEGIADAYFKDYTISFWNYFNGYITERRKAGATTLAQPIETYVKGRLADASGGSPG